MKILKVSKTTVRKLFISNNKVKTMWKIKNVRKSNTTLHINYNVVKEPKQIANMFKPVHESTRCRIYIVHV